MSAAIPGKKMPVPNDRRTFLLGTVLFGAASACSSGGGSKEAAAGNASSANSLVYALSPTESQLGVPVTDLTHPPGDVRRYGATGNGQTDDSTGIEAAIAVIRASGGGTVSLSPGTYRIVKTINDRGGSAPVTLDGSGATLLQTDEFSPCIRISDGNFAVVNLQFRFVSSSTATGAATGPVGAVHIAGGDRIQIRRCSFERLPYNAIVAHGETSASSDITIDACTFNEVRATAIRLNNALPAWPLTRVRAVSCSFIAPTDPISAQTRAIHVGEKVSEVRITGNTLSGRAASDYSMGWRDGIMIGNGTSQNQPSDVIVAQNHISGMADDGVGLSGAKSVSIVGNIITGSLVTSGIYAPADGTWRNSDINISANELKNHWLAGIFLKDTDGFTITGNQIQQCNGGIFALDSRSGGSSQLGTISNNTMQRLGNRAIHCETGTVSIAGNTILGFGNAASAAIVDQAAIFAGGGGRNAVITGNIFAEGQHGILISGDYDRLTITGNMSQSLRGYGAVFVDFSGQEWIITGNHLTGGQGQCAGLPQSAQGIFANNL